MTAPLDDACWVPVPAGSPFGPHTLPYGVVAPKDGGAPRPAVAIGAHVLDLDSAAAAGLLAAAPPGCFADGSLDRFLAAGPEVWAAVRARLRELLCDPAHRAATEPCLLPADSVDCLLPFSLADYVDFYSSRHHAENVGRMFRPDEPEPLPPNWRHMPLGYHGRAGTVAVSGTPVIRPCGQGRPRRGGPPAFGPSVALDIEAEVAFVVGVPSVPGTRVPAAALTDHVLGVVLLNDWSARDLQAWEYRPLGPFLGKSFATSVSPWVVPLAALADARVAPPTQEPAPVAALADPDPWSLDLRLEVVWNGVVVSRPPFASMYWTPGQQLAHLTSNGAALRTGDLFASGTVSGPERDQRGSLLELCWNGTEPIDPGDGRPRGWLADGDTVTIRGWAPGPGGVRIGLGEVSGTVLPARP